MKPCILKLYERLNRFIIDTTNKIMYRADKRISDNFYEMITSEDDT